MALCNDLPCKLQIVSLPVQDRVFKCTALLRQIKGPGPKEFLPMRFKSSLIALSLSLICFIPLVASADTLTLTGVDSNNVTDGIYTYPYYFSINGSTSSNDLSCLSFNREIQVNESWDVNTTILGSLLTSDSIDGSSDLQLREDAYLDSLYGTGFDNATDSEIQFAIWGILDPGGVAADNGPNAYDATAVYLDTLAANIAPNESTEYLNQFTLYTPVTPQGDQNWNNLGEPQEFLQFNPGTPQVPAPPPTPEPSSLILMGTGMLGIGLTMRRKLQTA
jgi:hypothetical protein